eukprot:scaffold5.g889.t1
MASSQSAFEKRERAAEEVFFMQEERAKMISRLEKLVEQGRLDKATLDRVKAATSPDPHHSIGVEARDAMRGPRGGDADQQSRLACGGRGATWRMVSPGVYKDVPAEGKKRGEYVYDHKPGGPPVPRISETERLNLVSHVDMGPGRHASTCMRRARCAPRAPRAALRCHPHPRPRGSAALRRRRRQAHGRTLARMAKIAKAMTEAPTLFGVK